jgi:hypothetical protein
MSFLAAALPSLVAGAFSAFGPGAGDARKAQKLQNKVIQNQLGIMQGLNRYGNSSLGADPLEQAQFAGDRAAMGQQQGQQRQDMMAAYQRSNPNGGAGMGDFLTNMNSNFTAQQMALNAQQVLAAMKNRQQALLQSAQVGQSVPQMQQTSNGLPELFGSLAQTYSNYQEGQRQDRQQKGQMALYQQMLNRNSGGAPGAPGPAPTWTPSAPVGAPNGLGFLGAPNGRAGSPSGFTPSFATPPTIGNYQGSR